MRSPSDLNGVDLTVAKCAFRRNFGSGIDRYRRLHMGHLDALQIEAFLHTAAKLALYAPILLHGAHGGNAYDNRVRVIGQDAEHLRHLRQAGNLFAGLLHFICQHTQQTVDFFFIGQANIDNCALVGTRHVW